MTFPILGQPNTGDTAWMLASSALVLLMTPGLAFFYGGMVRARSVLNMLMMSISAMGVVTVLWVLYGYSMSFGDDKSATSWASRPILGSEGPHRRQRRWPPIRARASAATDIPLAGTMPATVFVAFQLMFAIITVALISGRRGRPAEVRRLAGVRRPVGDVRLLPRRALGLRVRRFRVRARRLDRQQAARDRLRRRYRGPHQLRCGRPGAGDRSGQAQAAGPRRCSGRTTCRS